MHLLLKNITVCDPNSPYNKQTVDILIKNGIIENIKSGINAKNVAVKDCSNAFISPGWSDLTACSGEPGYEYKEDMRSLSEAGAAGGFTFIGCLPDTEPALHSKSEIEFITTKSSKYICQLIPIGAVTKDCKGEKLTDMIDLHHAGAFAFSNGLEKPLNGGVTEKSLFYIKAFNGLLITFPENESITQKAIMHEGPVSTRLGLSGDPFISEEVSLIRDIKLLEYTNSRLHIGAISTKHSLPHIKQAKSEKLRISSAVSVFHLLYDDNALESYDSLYKVKPPFRSKEDRKALKKALKDGLINCITGLHKPEDDDAKNVELDIAAYGMQSLETLYPAVLKAFDFKVTNEEIVNWLSINPRNIAGLPVPIIDINQEVEYTIFNPEEKWTYDSKNKKSKSNNNPFLNKEMTGRVSGVITKRGAYWNNSK
ncbi:MAG: dihydroorotase [Chitinophagaceae bacterium]|nr:MAG: dihydroorotase [Chitinophagaceae bacterium]